VATSSPARSDAAGDGGLLSLILAGAVLGEIVLCGIIIARIACEQKSFAKILCACLLSRHSAIFHFAKSNCPQQRCLLIYVNYGGVLINFRLPVAATIIRTVNLGFRQPVSFGGREIENMVVFDGTPDTQCVKRSSHRLDTRTKARSLQGRLPARPPTERWNAVLGVVQLLAVKCTEC